MPSHRIDYSSPWTCVLCFAKGKGEPSRQKHLREIHGEHRGMGLKGRTGHKPGPNNPYRGRPERRRELDAS